jgi:methionyl-tRNA formyltransferase
MTTDAFPTLIFGAQRDLMLPAYTAVSRLAPTMLIRRPEDLNATLLDRIRPRYVLLPDWSWLIDEELLARSTFVGFHPSDLPDYRGGSPLQHQILDGLTRCPLTCFQIEKGIDTGPILLQEELSLAGSIGEIWDRSVALIPGMVARLLTGDFTPQAQRPGGFTRKRRTPAMSRLDPDWDLDRLYDFIRMLDDPYPNAFLDIADKRLYLRTVRHEGERLRAEVLIEQRDHPAANSEGDGHA